MFNSELSDSCFNLILGMMHGHLEQGGWRHDTSLRHITKYKKDYTAILDSMDRYAAHDFAKAIDEYLKMIKNYEILSLRSVSKKKEAEGRSLMKKEISKLFLIDEFLTQCFAKRLSYEGFKVGADRIARITFEELNEWRDPSALACKVWLEEDLQAKADEMKKQRRESLTTMITALAESILNEECTWPVDDAAAVLMADALHRPKDMGGREDDFSMKGIYERVLRAEANERTIVDQALRVRAFATTVRMRIAREDAPERIPTPPWRADIEAATQNKVDLLAPLIWDAIDQKLSYQDYVRITASVADQPLMSFLK